MPSAGDERPVVDLDAAGRWEHRARQMLEAIAEANEAGTEPRLPLTRQHGDGYLRHVQLLDDLLDELLAVVDMKQKSGGGDYVILRGLRLTSQGRGRLQELQRREDEQFVALTEVECRRIEAVLTAVERLEAAGKLDHADPDAQLVLARARVLRIEVYESPKPDRGLIRRALELMGKAVGAVGANVVANQLTPLVTAAITAIV